MNNQITITSYSDFEKITFEIENSISKLKETFEKLEKELEKMNNPDTWTSNSQKVTYSKFMNAVSIFPLINNKLDRTTGFLKYTLNNYRTVDDKTAKRIINHNDLNTSI